MIPQAVLMRSGLKTINTARLRATVNAAKPKAVHNVVKRNWFHDVKASACWVWKPKNRVIDHGGMRPEPERGEAKAKDKGNAKMEESESAMTKTKRQQEQERLGFEVAVRLQAELDKEERQRISRAEATLAVESFVNLSNKSGSDKGYHSDPPPLTGNFIPRKPDLTFMDEIVESENLDVTTVVTPSNVKTVENKDVSSTVESNAVRMTTLVLPRIED
ncbi:hypothetical protein Tco_0628533 [Tanacetum coccineum]|uniref:Uncharacterized protein n=1 Tax=Tanacetum coccineum TaxID=301880 RepID=A0ABQ4WRB1_9ASTR